MKLQALLDTYGLTDCWRHANPGSRDYSFYSPRHDVHTRIDYILTNNSDVGTIHSASIGTKTLSDHALVSCCFTIEIQKPCDRNWTMDKTLLLSTLSMTEIAEAIRAYLSTNDNAEWSEAIVWDALKSTLRGDLISLTASVKCARQLEIENLQCLIRELETIHKRTNSKKKLPATFKRT